MNKIKNQETLAKIDKYIMKNSNIFQKIGWKILEFIEWDNNHNFLQWFSLVFSILTLIIVIIKKS